MSQRDSPFLGAWGELCELHVGTEFSWFQNTMPWNYMISLERLAKQAHLQKLDPSFYSQPFLERDSVYHCRQYCKTPAIVFIEVQTKFPYRGLDHDWKPSTVREKIQHTPEIQLFLRLRRAGYHCILLPHDPDHLLTLRKAGYPYLRFEGFPRERISSACLSMFGSSWIAAYVDYATLSSYHVRNKVFPRSTVGLKAHKFPLTVSSVSDVLQRVLGEFLNLFSLTPNPTRQIQLEQPLMLNTKTFNRKKFCVNFVYPGIQVGSVPMWIECGELLDMLNFS